jgi:hypothetical protein
MDKGPLPCLVSEVVVAPEIAEGHQAPLPAPAKGHSQIRAFSHRSGQCPPGSPPGLRPSHQKFPPEASTWASMSGFSSPTHPTGGPDFELPLCHLFIQRLSTRGPVCVRHCVRGWGQQGTRASPSFTGKRWLRSRGERHRLIAGGG